MPRWARLLSFCNSVPSVNSVSIIGVLGSMANILNRRKHVCRLPLQITVASVHTSLVTPACPRDV